jgi:hypothetical protein
MSTRLRLINFYGFIKVFTEHQFDCDNMSYIVKGNNFELQKRYNHIVVLAQATFAPTGNVSAQFIIMWETDICEASLMQINIVRHTIVMTNTIVGNPVMQSDISVFHISQMRQGQFKHDCVVVVGKPEG